MNNEKPLFPCVLIILGCNNLEFMEGLEIAQFAGIACTYLFAFYFWMEISLNTKSQKQLVRIEIGFNPLIRMNQAEAFGCSYCRCYRH